MLTTIVARLVVVIDVLVAGNNTVLQDALAVIAAIPVTIVTILWMRATVWEANMDQER